MLVLMIGSLIVSSVSMFSVRSRAVVVSSRMCVWGVEWCEFIVVSVVVLMRMVSIYVSGWLF